MLHAVGDSQRINLTQPCSELTKALFYMRPQTNPAFHF